MNRLRFLSTAAVAFLASFLALALGSQVVTHSAAPRQTLGPTSPRHYIVAAGYGNDDWAVNVYAPHRIDIYAGDSMTWVNRGRIEPHTITFGPMSQLRQLFKQKILLAPQKGGAPQLVMNPAFALPTRSPTYDGTGFANSGILRQGQRWTITFTRPGTYRYHCLFHFPGMFGVVVVHPRPAQARTYYVRPGYGSTTSAADVFFPEVLTVHVGSTVIWTGAIFHTITFAPAATIDQLRKQLIVPIPQQVGPPKLILNPRTAFPAGGRVENGIAFLSSGILQPPHNQFSVTFTKPGVYHYGCLVHPGMDGTIQVVP
ncbi:MAG: plastocyanin/azurin family copper-binding protein [Chloroflexota bacterium]|nr:plastocyanin/azurin family copper-binding protein [Chloroflexota bacterium]